MHVNYVIWKSTESVREELNFLIEKETKTTASCIITLVANKHSLLPF